MTLGIIIAVVVVLCLYVIGVRNSLVTSRNKVRSLWSQIDVQLKRRFDLIPNLVETVKGYAKHEKETLEGVVNARNAYASAKTPEEAVKADNELTKTVSKLFALAESYPDLKANENFMDLQKQLTDIEEKIAYSRQFYTDSVMKYNTQLEKFPANLVASLFKFEPEAFFEASSEEKENVKVKF